MKKLLQIVDKAGAKLLPRTTAEASCGPVTTTYSDCFCDVDCTPDGGLHAYYWCITTLTSPGCPSSQYSGCTTNQCR